MELKPIGVVNRLEDKIRIVIEEPYRRGLQTLDDFEYIWILWWMHRNQPDDVQLVILPKFPYVPKEGVGIFATRSSKRPNPIGLSISKIRKADIPRGVIEIDRIDADSGSPILDIKPYLPKGDSIEPNVKAKMKIPKWPRSLDGCFEEPMYRRKRDDELKKRGGGINPRKGNSN